MKESKTAVKRRRMPNLTRRRSSWEE